MRKTVIFFYLENIIFIVQDIRYTMQAQNLSFILPKCFSIVLKTDICYFLQGPALIFRSRLLLFVTLWFPAKL